jgi:hypothetical protein
MARSKSLPQPPTGVEAVILPRVRHLGGFEVAPPAGAEAAGDDVRPHHQTGPFRVPCV